MIDNGFARRRFNLLYHAKGSLLFDRRNVHSENGMRCGCLRRICGIVLGEWWWFGVGRGWSSVLSVVLDVGPFFQQPRPVIAGRESDQQTMTPVECDAMTVIVAGDDAGGGGSVEMYQA